MKLVTPSLPSVQTVNRHFRFSPSSPSDGAELELSHAELNSRSLESEKVYVAVSRSEEKTAALLRWTIRTFRCSDVCLVHVHQPSPFIPTLLGKLPAAQANGEVVSAYRREEKKKMNRLLSTYFNVCVNAKVEASIFVIESEQVRTGLVDMVVKHGIQKLVIGSVPDNCMRLKRSSSKASYAVKNAPAFCEIWFVDRGRHVWTREATSDPHWNANRLIIGRSSSKSLQYNRNECLYNADNLRFHSSRLGLHSSGIADCIQNEDTEVDLLLPETCNPDDLYHNGYARNSSSLDSASVTSEERRISADSIKKLEEGNLYSQLLEVKEDSDKLKSKAIAERVRRKKMEAEAIQAIKKVKEIETSYAHEAKVRKEGEDVLTRMTQEQERLLEERLELTGELQRTMRNVAIFDTRVQEANHRCDEATEELKLIHISIASLRQEKLRIQKQKMGAELWLERWKNKRQVVGTNRNGHGGFLEHSPEIVEFSLFDLQNATYNFSDSFIVNGGYGCVYKGELLNRTVAIQRLPPQNTQGASQFHKQVQLLAKLRHPHLVNLVGACPEGWFLVFDYVPNGPLKLHLLNKSNITPLSWKIRARIISEISAGVLFLHTSDPVICHGDLNLETILLDSDLHCKICDFGISRMLSQETLVRCPSFGRYPDSQGAFPYTDPEYHRTGKLSKKSDVYSFGIVILQLLTGKPPLGLVANVRKAVSCGKLSSVLDTSAGDWGPYVAEKLANIALRFCQQNSRDRPELTPSLVKELQQLHISEERTVPSFFLCPILQEMMCEPLVAADGFSYEGEAIGKWLDNGRETSPMTNLRLNHLHLTPNHSLRLAIQEWLCKC